MNATKSKKTVENELNIILLLLSATMILFNSFETNRVLPFGCIC